MKTRFETNVAREVPKTRMSQEPGLPWKLNPEDLEKLSPAKEEYKAAITGTPPLKTRPVFLIVLLAVVFAAVMYFVSIVIKDNENAQTSIQKREVTMLSFETALEKMNNEKNALSENLGQLEKRVGELNAQKELFATVIESLTKKTDEPSAQSETEKPVQQETVNTQGTAQGTTSVQ